MCANVRLQARRLYSNGATSGVPPKISHGGCLHHQKHGLLPEQVFLLFKSSRTHMMLACTLSDSASGLPSGKQGALSVRSQQNFLSKFSKKVTGVITLEDGELSVCLLTDAG